MPGLILQQSNQMERLADALADELRGFRRDPLAAVSIVVQSRGMERWLNIELARRLGIACNLRFPFPNTILDDIFRATLGEQPDASLFDPDVLALRILQRLPDCLAEPVFAPLKDYLAADDSDLRRFQLSDRIAAMYDQLGTFRPELIRAWHREPVEDWQGQLWTRLIPVEERVWHRAELHARCLEAMQQAEPPLAGLPDKLFVFGIATLPPLHLDLLAAVARTREVHLFLLNPCAAFWEDIASDKIQVKQARRLGSERHAEDDLHFDRGHPLLASQGVLGQEFLVRLSGYDLHSHELFRSPAGSGLLGRLQQQILTLRDPDGCDRESIADDDTSIRIHSCHSPLREVEVLRDQILDLLQSDPSLEARDILVMAPDIESYAPYITAVFDAETDDALRLPFTIADRSGSKESPLDATFLKLLAMRRGRLTASDVLELLEETVVRQRFDLSLDDLALIRHWIGETHIRWGADGRFKERFGLPATEQNTWQDGLRRMLLGFALPTGETALYRGILPYDEIEGSSADLLGRLHCFCTQLFAVLDDLESPRRLDQWSRRLATLLDDFFLSDSEDALLRLHRQLGSLARLATASDFAGAVDFDLVLYVLKKQLTAPTRSGFLRGGVTFCSLLPMRSIPFRVVALLGMDDKAFPRKSRTTGFDPMATDPRRGEPSRRKEDRQLFLEAILSARDTLLISYLGQNCRDNSEAPPAVVVAELLDALDAGFVTASGQLPRNRIVVKHRLQAFHPDYFRGGEGRLFSFSQANRAGAIALLGANSPQTPFMAGDLPLPDDDPRRQTVTLGQLVDFVSNPARFFLRQRLNIFLRKEDDTLENQEPFVIDGLTGYQLSQELVERALGGTATEQLFPLWQARGVLPHGQLARPAWANCAATAAELVDAVHEATDTDVPQSREFELQIDDLRLVGTLHGLYPNGPVNFRCASIKGKDRLTTWLRHLVTGAVALQDGETPQESLLLGKENQRRRYAVPADATALLADLLDIYRQGLLRPLPFFPEAALAWAEAAAKEAPERVCLSKARDKWQTNDHRRGEDQDSDFDFCFGRSDPFASDFCDLARRLCTPLLAHERKG
ncbi:MAG: exodeoxyribonuclease V subunit gamma [Desulfuromonadales bacterium]|nr:exodeoxyribonuclease V subunit gamma [Desulfuromonadales bacterium]